MSGDPKECCRRSFGESAADTTKRLAEDSTIAPVEVRKERMGICESCEHLVRFNRCEICGCFMNLKTKFANMRCPLPEPKWTEYEYPTN